MRSVVLCVLCGVALLGLAGCNIVGGTAALLAPPEKVEAKYELPDKPTLIVIDDASPRPMVNSEATLRRVAGSIRAALEAEEVVTTGFIGQDELAALREELGDEYRQTSLAALAIRLNARQVIHAEVSGYQVDVGGNIIRPSIVMNVKVFDIDERARVFPSAVDPETGFSVGDSVYPVQTNMPARNVSGQGAARTIAVRDLADMAGRDIARLFFDWRVPERGSTLGE
ncbi:MAG: hypothetical protein ACE37H_15090 [Phycisphaeraceae bacterium]